MNIVRNRKGIGYFVPCIITLAFAMILSVLLSLCEMTAQITGVRKEIRSVLREQMQEASTASFDTIKRGWIPVPDILLPDLADALCDRLNLSDEQGTLTATDERGAWKYRLRLSRVDNESTGTEVSCTLLGRLELPVRFLGTEVSVLSIPFRTDSYLNAKWSA